MKREDLLRVKRHLLAAVLISLLGQLLFANSASAAQTIETFGTAGSCAIQTSGLTVVQNGSNAVDSSANGLVGIGSPYAGQFGMVGCHISFIYIHYDVDINFPTNAQPTSFKFFAGAVDGIQPALIRYADNTTETFTVSNANPPVGETRTVTGNGKLIAGFTIQTWVQSDYWFLDNLTWTAAAKSPTTLNLSLASQSVYKGIRNTITATASAPGKVTFYANQKRIPGCISLPISSSIGCNWKPPVQGSVQLRTVFTPSDTSLYEASSATLSARVAKRTTTR